MLRGVIFDMDGVLVNSEPMHDKAYQKMLEKEFQITLPRKYFEPFIGTTNATVYEALRRDYQISSTNTEMDELVRRYNRIIIEEQGFEGIEGIPELLKSLKENGMLLSVASSSPMESIVEVTKELKIDHFFDYLVSGEQVPNPKPAPDVFLKAASDMGLRPDECLIIEDSTNGVNAAKAAKIPCIGFLNPDSGNQNLINAAMLVEGFEEVDYSFVSNVYKRSRGEPLAIAETDRLLIREMTVEDIDELSLFYEDKKIVKYIGMQKGREEEIEMTKAYITNMYGFYGYGMWVVIEKNSNRIVGKAGLNNREVNGDYVMELGYMIGVPYQRQGYAYEACREILSYAGKQLDCSVIHCFIEPDNTASLSLAAKLGFIKKGKATISPKIYLWYYQEL